MRWGSSYYADSKGVVHRRLKCSIEGCGHFRQLTRTIRKDGTKFYHERRVCCQHRVDGSMTRHSFPDRQKQHHWKQQGIHLSADEFVQIFNLQGGDCIICGVNQGHLDYKLCVDHNHETGKIRGIICKPCNAMLAWFEKTLTLDLLKEYLETDVFDKYKDKIIETSEFKLLRSN